MRRRACQGQDDVAVAGPVTRTVAATVMYIGVPRSRGAQRSCPRCKADRGRRLHSHLPASTPGDGPSPTPLISAEPLGPRCGIRSSVIPGPANWDQALFVWTTRPGAARHSRIGVVPSRTGGGRGKKVAAMITQSRLTFNEKRLTCWTVDHCQNHSGAGKVRMPCC